MAYTIQGECADICPLTALLAIAWLIHRQPTQTWYGYAEPGLNAQYVARYYWQMQDPTPWAEFAFSDQDLELGRVQKIVGGMRCERIACKNGLGLNLCGEE